MAKKLTARTAIALHNNARQAMLKGRIPYKQYVQQIVEDYGIKQTDALKIANGKDLLQIVAKYEVESE